MARHLFADRAVPPNDPVLVRVAEAVPINEITGAQCNHLIADMVVVAKGDPADNATLVGLAAPQIGISKRIAVVDIAADGKKRREEREVDLRVYVNPEIVWSSKEENEWYEGCFSTAQVCGIVSRPTRIRLRAYNPGGELIEEEHEGYVARILQHEVDHLNGKEFTMHIADPDKLHWVEDEEFPAYRGHGRINVRGRSG